LVTKWDIMQDIGTGAPPESIMSPIDGAEMVFVSEGDFSMGLTEEQLSQVYLLEQKWNPVFVTETPEQTIQLPGYYIDRYPVTNYQYGKFIEETGHRAPLLWREHQWNQPFQPVVFVGWEDARTYARWCDKSLPTEPQWEKAARGTDGRLWAWGDEFYPDRCNSREYGEERTTEIGLFDMGASPYGCYDMCGNVWEMCDGYWIEDLLPMRGGCFLGSPSFVRTTCRWSPEDTTNGAHWLGFRCIKNLPTPPTQIN
jgi:formylglycine-generating enzyme required for sulfatase activity